MSVATTSPQRSLQSKNETQTYLKALDAEINGSTKAAKNPLPQQGGNTDINVGKPGPLQLPDGVIAHKKPEGKFAYTCLTNEVGSKVYVRNSQLDKDPKIAADLKATSRANQMQYAANAQKVLETKAQNPGLSGEVSLYPIDAQGKVRSVTAYKTPPKNKDNTWATIKGDGGEILYAKKEEVTGKCTYKAPNGELTTITYGLFESAKGDLKTAYVLGGDNLKRPVWVKSSTPVSKDGTLREVKIEQHVARNAKDEIFHYAAIDAVSGEQPPKGFKLRTTLDGKKQWVAERNADDPKRLGVFLPNFAYSAERTTPVGEAHSTVVLFVRDKEDKDIKANEDILRPVKLADGREGFAFKPEALEKTV